jgi:amino acid transporter
MKNSGEGIGTFSTLSIGIGGTVGGGIFATTGLAVEMTGAAAPVAFALGGVIAMLTAYSYWKLTLRFPGTGGTVEFLNRGFGPGLLTGSLNILLCLSYVVLLAVYAYAFGAYVASFVDDPGPVHRAAVIAVLVACTLVNVVGSGAALRAENVLNAIKMAILVALIGVAVASPLPAGGFAISEWSGPLAIVSGAMIVFFNYEGFELISNASGEVRDPSRALPIAYLGGIAAVIVIYVGLVTAVIAHLDIEIIRRTSTWVLSALARDLVGLPGHIVVAAAAMMATASAILVTLLGAGRLMDSIARSRELPEEFERKILGMPLEGMFVFAALALALALLAPLNMIATMGSAGFLIVFLGVNLAAARLSPETGGSRVVSATGSLLCGIALVVLCIEVDAVPATRGQIWILVGMIAVSVATEGLYRLRRARS